MTLKKILKEIFGGGKIEVAPCGCPMFGPFHSSFVLFHKGKEIQRGKKQIKRYICSRKRVFWEIELPPLKKIDVPKSHPWREL